MGFINTLLLDWRVALSALRSEDAKNTLSVVAITAIVVSLTITLIRKHRSQSIAAIFLESHVIGIALEKKEGWLGRLLINPKAVIHGMSSSRAIIVEPALGQTILRRPHEVLNNDPMHWALQKRVFGCREAIYTTVAPLMRPLFSAVSQNLLSEAAMRPVFRATNTMLGEKVMDLVPPLQQVGPISDAAIETRPWLKDVGAMVDSDGAVELDLYVAIRDLTTYITTNIIAGEDLMKQYPDITSDLFTLDAGFGLLGLGFPTWLPVELIKRAVTARKRIIAGLGAFNERLEAVATGRANGALVERMKGTNQMWYDRSALYRTVNLGFEDRGAMDVAVLWAMNANSSPAVFWMAAYLLTHKDALATVRKEVAPYISVTSLSEPATVDADSIVTKAPRLKACLLESLRLASEPHSIRHVEQDFTVAHPVSKTPLSFRRGGHLILPHNVHHHDGAAYPEPHAFRPERFLTRIREGDNDQKRDAAPVTSISDPGLVCASYGSLKPWGDGPLICKGRLFAEREMLVEVALLVSVWDMQPLEPGVPNRLVGTGVAKPDRPMRVKVRRRVVEA